jgi:transcriptional regulator
MYTPKHFEETRVEVMHELIRERPLATVVTLTSQGLNANHIPLHLFKEPGSFGVLRGHVARSNPVWNDILTDVEVLTIFHGPDTYITPSWYATKKESGKVVPTWNYTVVHAYGKLQVIDDPVWLRTQLEILTDRNEKQFPEPWAFSDAPRDYTDTLIGAIVGIEIVINRLSGKWKVSQNQSAQNREGVISGLENSDTLNSTAMAMLLKTHSM